MESAPIIQEGETLEEETSISTVHKTDTKQEVEDEELRSLLIPDPSTLPTIPPSAVESNFVRYYATDFMKPGHDQYIYRHANGLCVIGLAPTHVAFNEEGGVTSVNFNVGKSDRSEIKVTGKRKRNAHTLEPNSALCKVCTDNSFYVVRCCVKGSLLEVNDRLIKKPDLINSSDNARSALVCRFLEEAVSTNYERIAVKPTACYVLYIRPSNSILIGKDIEEEEEDVDTTAREGYIAVIMPKPTDWLKIKDSLLIHEDYRKLRGLC